MGTTEIRVRVGSEAVSKERPLNRLRLGERLAKADVARKVDGEPGEERETQAAAFACRGANMERRMSPAPPPIRTVRENSALNIP